MKFTITVISFLIALVSWPHTDEKKLTNKSVSTQTDEIYNKLVKIRRDIHAHPELAGNEIRTQEIIKQYLLDLGLEVKTGIYGHGIIGVLNGAKKGRSIAWRADMDALKGDFADRADFKSKIAGVQHGCGHDVHIAIALGIAEILAKNKESLKGTAYFIFQPEEETFVGAKGMIDSGLFSIIHPNEIYGLHVTNLPVGKIMVKPAELFAYQRLIRIELKNELSKEAAKALAKKIKNELSRYQTNSKPWEIQNISDPKTGLVNPSTIFKNYLITDENFRIYSKEDKLFLEAYLYETDRPNLQKIIAKIKTLINQENYAEKLLSVSFIQENPTVVNNKTLTQKAIKILAGIYGDDVMMPDYGQVPYFNDDFAYFQQKVPGVYFFLGGSNSEKGMVAMNHAPNFNVDEESIRTGVRSFSSLLIERLNNK